MFCMPPLVEPLQHVRRQLEDALEGDVRALDVLHLARPLRLAQTLDERGLLLGELRFLDGIAQQSDPVGLALTVFEGAR